MTRTPDPGQEEEAAPVPRGPSLKDRSSMTQRLTLDTALDTVDRGAKAAMRRTAHISLRPESIEDLAGPTPTRRKTIRVKRAAVPVSVSAPAGADGTVLPLARPAGGVAGRKDSTLQESLEASPGPIFVAAALAAISVACVLIYVLAAQVLGPNDSLTPLSYNQSGPRLPWPGRIGGGR
jgi:hypothetical protein